MTMRTVTALMLMWWMGTTSLVGGHQIAAVFPMSSVEHVDAHNQLLTFKAQDGQVRMFRVAESVAMARGTFTRGDLVSIEVDLDDQIVKIVKVPPPTVSDRRAARLK
jgi:hypothetical protein